MSLRRENFKVKHFEELNGKNAVQLGVATQELEGQKYSYAYFDGPDVVMVGGVIEYWFGRGESWAVISDHHRSSFIKVHNSAKRFFDECPIRRIEMSVVCGFENGHRWARALGFTLEAERLRAYLPNGKDAALYARVR